jgi:hypothetical protein
MRDVNLAGLLEPGHLIGVAVVRQPVALGEDVLLEVGHQHSGRELELLGPRSLRPRPAPAEAAIRSRRVSEEDGDVQVDVAGGGDRDGVDLEPRQFVLFRLAQLTELARDQRQQSRVELMLVQGPKSASDWRFAEDGVSRLATGLGTSC